MTPPTEKTPRLASSQRVDLGELNTTLGFLLRVAQVRIFDSFYERFGDDGLRPGEFSTLLLIDCNPGIRQGLLAQTLWIKPAHMTKMIRRLEDQALITREIPDDDRRSVKLDLTEAGRAYVADQRLRHSGANDYHRHDLTPTEERELARLLRKFTGLDR